MTIPSPHANPVALQLINAHEVKANSLVTRAGAVNSQPQSAWLQLSVFQCRLSGKRLAELRAACQEIVKAGEDHVLIMDLGPAHRAEPRVESIGKPFSAVERGPIIV